ncbi:proline--tRNA ligase [Oxalobacter vibrioformis]|uniref:Proline--tRNA ligase n=1 Tax=Oxalobacter vibrioformis TaxID=933080 RepID=A0A9E9LYU8_9BURK|nr:proline--tRNA ligase [Oxalobacter vibrioformis]WAW11006.1 proline--tRNA ligase [Oxalobacter vibrioformis]
MRASQFFISTLKEAPADAEIISHKLMMRTGMIRRLGSGIYTYMPLGLRIIRKIEKIIREEMNRSGAVELLMPLVQPAELWQETGRWEKYGPELLRIKDRHGRDFIIQPTSEEVVTDIARSVINSYRQMPVNFYHIQTKFRDERRPRFGLMRGREFTMKDAYSFDRHVEGMEKSYQIMFDTYTRIFTRIGLHFRSVAADNGTIGGTGSHEFHVIAETGEDALVYCPTSDYAANMEAAESLPPSDVRPAPAEAMQKVLTPGKKSCEDVTAFLNMPLEKSVKVIAAIRLDAAEDAPDRFAVILLRGDHDLNEIKTQKIIGPFRFAAEDEIVQYTGTPSGYLGPVGLDKKPGIAVYADHTVTVMGDFICGANEVDHHLTGVNWDRDVPLPPVIMDFRNVVEGDLSPDGKGTLAILRGIEVGHVFQLGTHYSSDMNATFLDENGKSQFMQMGCYGIGVTRIMGAAIEQNNDERGIIWPLPIAPFDIVLCPMGYERSELVRKTTDDLLAGLLEAGIDAILDDRGERPGVMFADWELIGVPHRVVIGERGLKENMLEYQGRRDDAATTVPQAEIMDFIQKKLAM